MKVRIITGLALLWHLLSWIWSILIVGIIVGLLGNATYTYLTTGRLDVADPRTLSIIWWAHTHLLLLTLTLFGVLALTLCAWLADRYQEKVAQRHPIPQKEARYEPHFEAPLQGLIIGEHNTVTIYSGRVSSDQQRPQEPALPLWNVPYPRNSLFTGREELLKQLHDQLTNRETVMPTQALSGLGGIGKTQTAVEYAYRYRDEYRVVAWVRADMRETLVVDFITIAHLLNLPEKDVTDNSLTIRTVKDWLERHTGWLIIFDNADNITVIRDFLPSNGKGHILLTTRSYATGNIANRIEVEKMTVAQGALFLLRRAKVIASNTQLRQIPETDYIKAKEVAKVVDGLPLALDEAGAYIEETGCGLSGFLTIYQQERKVLLRRRSILSTDHPQSVVTTFSLCFQKVEKANLAAANLLRLCAFLPEPDVIFEDDVRQLIRKNQIRQSHLRDLAVSPIKWNSAIEELLKYSLIRRNPYKNTLSIHRLVQSVTRDQMPVITQNLWAKSAKGYFASNLIRELSLADIGNIPDKFTERARRVLYFAQLEAQRLQRDCIDTEHLLLGLLREGEGAGAKVLIHLGIELNKARDTVESITGIDHRHQIKLDELYLTDRSKKVIELAVDEARSLNHHHIGTEHILLGLLNEGEGAGVEVLERLGVDIARTRVQIIDALSLNLGTEQN